MNQSRQEISRVSRSKEEARAAYDRLSRWYDVLAARSERRPRESGVRKLAVGDGEKVLEIGCGTGHSIVALARSVGCSGRVYGIDLSRGMLDVTRRRIGKAALLGRVHLLRGDAANLPFFDGSFDAVLMTFTLELFDTPEIPAVLHECHRVLRDGGRLGVVAMARKAREGIMVRLYEWAHRTFPKYFDCRPIFLRHTLEDAAFEIVEATALSMWGLPVEVVVVLKPQP